MMLQKVVCKAAWLGTGLAAVYLGLSALGYDVVSMLGLHAVARPLYLALGVLGLVSLMCMWQSCATGKCCTCGK